MGLILGIGLPLLFTLGPWIFSLIAGNWYQAKKFKQLEERVHSFGPDNLTTLRSSPGPVVDSGLVTAGLIVSVSWWQLLMGWLKGILGGNIKTWDRILDWGRAEAQQRLREEAKKRGFTNVLNMRLETSILTTQKGRSTSIEILAYGTGITQ